VRIGKRTRQLCGFLGAAWVTKPLPLEAAAVQFVASYLTSVMFFAVVRRVVWDSATAKNLRVQDVLIAISSISLVTFAACLIMRQPAGSMRLYQGTHLYKNFEQDDDVSFAAGNISVVPISMVLMINAFVNFVSKSVEGVDVAPLILELCAQCHFLVAFALPSYLLIACGSDGKQAVLAYVGTGVMANSLVLNGSMLKIVTTSQHHYQFWHIVFVSSCYALSTILETSTNMFLINDAEVQAQVMSASLILSIPLYLLEPVCIYATSSIGISLIRGQHVTDDAVESFSHSFLILAYFVSIRIVSLVYPQQIQDLPIEAMTNYVWLHVSYYVFLSTLPTAILNIRFAAAQTKVSKTESEKVELQSLTKQLEHEKQRALKLLYNMVPREVAIKLSTGAHVEARAHPFACVFFADVKGFTPFASEVPPMDVFRFLNVLISAMDACISHFPRLYKVETVGDSYMVVGGIVYDGNVSGGGVPSVECDSLHEMIQFGTLTQRILSTLPFGLKGTSVPMRMGVHCGPVVAGLVGTLTPRFCLFGDTINFTSRLESTGEPGLVQVSSAVIELLKERGGASAFEWSLRTPAVELKGKGVMDTYWVNCRDESALRVKHHLVAKRLLDAGTNVSPPCYYCRDNLLVCACAKVEARVLKEIGEAQVVSPALAVKTELDHVAATDIGGSALVLHRGKSLPMANLAWTSPSPSPCSWPLAKLYSLEFEINLVKSELEIFHGLVAIFLGTVDLASLSIDEQVLRLFIWNVTIQYRPVSYHCLYHAFCVVQCLAYLLQQHGVAEMFSPKHIFVLLVAGLVHDVGHPGTTNAKEIADNSYLALIYDKQSPLEQMHLDITFSLLQDARLNVFGHWSRSEVQMAHSLITKVVLDTDMQYHDLILQQLQSWASDGLPPSNIVDSFDHSLSLASILVHAADLSNACRLPHITAYNSYLLECEFKSAAGLNSKPIGQDSVTITALKAEDVEGGVGGEPSSKSQTSLPAMTKSNAKNEIGFFKGLVRPYFVALSDLFPSLQPLVENIDNNIKYLTVIAEAGPL